jgi:HTH-type transcriptional regulator/antitoxin HipB
MGDIMQTIIFTSKQLATMLKARRKALRLTQKEVAALVGLLPKTVSSLETDPDRCSVESLRMLLSALKLELTLSPEDEGASAVREAEW